MLFVTAPRKKLSDWEICLQYIQDNGVSPN